MYGLHYTYKQTTSSFDIHALQICTDVSVRSNISSSSSSGCAWVEASNQQMLPMHLTDSTWTTTGLDIGLLVTTRSSVFFHANSDATDMFCSRYLNFECRKTFFLLLLANLTFLIFLSPLVRFIYSENIFSEVSSTHQKCNAITIINSYINKRPNPGH